MIILVIIPVIQFFLSVGHFAFFSPTLSGEHQIAQLESETMEAVDQACLELWHQAQAWASNRECSLFLLCQAIILIKAQNIMFTWINGD